MLPWCGRATCSPFKALRYDELIPGDIVLVLRDNASLFTAWLKGEQVRIASRGLPGVTLCPMTIPPRAASELLGRVASIRRGQSQFRSEPASPAAPFRSGMDAVPLGPIPQSHVAHSCGVCRIQALREPDSFFADVFGAVRGIPAISPSSSLHHTMTTPSHHRGRDRIHRDRRNGDRLANARPLISPADRESLRGFCRRLRRTRTSNSISICASHRESADACRRC